MPKSIVADVITTAADTPEIKAIAAKAAGAAFVKADTAIIKKRAGEGGKHTSKSQKESLPV